MPVQPTNANYDSIQSAYFDVKRDFAAQGDGVTDDAPAIKAAIAALVADFGGGRLYFPAGVYVIGSTITLKPLVHLIGAGIEVTTLQLAAGVNADMLSASTNLISLGATFGTGNVGVLHSFFIQDMTLDGNQANQSSGTSYPLRFYGCAYILKNLVVKNGYSGNILCDWNKGNTIPSGANSMEAQWVNVKTHASLGIGIQFGGPHDSQFVNVIPYQEGTHCMHLAPNAAGAQLVNCHGWGPAAGSVGLLCEAADVYSANSEFESSDTVQVAILNDGFEWIGGNVFGASPFTSTGFQIGQQAGNTPYTGQIFQAAAVTTAKAPKHCRINSRIRNCKGSNGAVWFANDGGRNSVEVTADQSTGNAYAGTPNQNTRLAFLIDGLTADGTRGKGGVFLFPVNATGAFAVTDNSHDVLNVNTTNKHVDLNNGTFLQVYSDDYMTLVDTLNADGAGSLVLAGGLSIGQSATPAATGAGGTIATAGLGVSLVSPVAARTGCILQAGTVAGQMCWVVNEAVAANSITFAASGTSHVAGGVNDVIPGLQGRLYVWDANASLWYATPQIATVTAFVQSGGAAAATGASGTITTASVNVARVSPTAARAGIIMQPGTIAGQVCLVVNEAVQGFTLTFDTNPATSNVADAANCSPLDGLSSRLFIWDSSTSLWYAQSQLVGGSVAPLQSATAVAIVSTNTIATANIGVSRVSPAAAVTGIILAAGAYPGQMVLVVNEAAQGNTITFNTTDATSKVAGSANLSPIDGLSSRLFVWDSVQGLWYAQSQLTAGSVSLVQSATAPDPGASGTVATAGIGLSRVSPSGASRTGCILAAGAYPGQEVWVVNEHASNTISWATQATSHISGEAGGTYVLAAKAAQKFVYDTGTSLWYKTS